jgi:hypothetical protein
MPTYSGVPVTLRSTGEPGLAGARDDSEPLTIGG